MKLTKLENIFNIVYGNQLDLNKLDLDSKGVNFVSRSRGNLGVTAKVKKIANKVPFEKGSITVSLGGTYLLSSFVQQEDFYTGQNIKVLTPKSDLTDKEKQYYCYVIEHNRFRYTSHGREANKTLDELLVPTICSMPEWVKCLEVDIPDIDCAEAGLENSHLDTHNWKYFLYEDIFEIEKLEVSGVTDFEEVNLISASTKNNGVSDRVESENYFPANLITVSSNGAVGDAFYQSEKFSVTGDVHVLKLKFNLNPFIALFLTTIIEQEKFRFNYGRKWGERKMLKHKIKLPSKEINISQNKYTYIPDWQFMENYIKALPYSSNLTD